MPRVTVAAPRIVAGLPVCLTGDESDTRRRIGQWFAMAAEVPEYRAILDRDGAAGPQDVALAGDEEAIARGLRRLAEAGVTEFLAAPFGDAREQARTVRLLRDLAGELRPG